MFESYVATMPQTTDLEDGLCVVSQLGEAIEISLIRFVESQGNREQAQNIVYEFLTQLGGAVNDGSWRRSCLGKPRLAQTVELLRRFLIICKSHRYSVLPYKAWFIPDYLADALTRVGLIDILLKDI